MSDNFSGEEPNSAANPPVIAPPLPTIAQGAPDTPPVTTTTTVETTVQKIDGVVHTAETILHDAGPIAAMFIPGAGPVIAGLEWAGEEIESFIDPASNAAQNISVSTGNEALDARLLAIESFMEQVRPFIAKALPILKYVEKELGMG